MFLVFNWQFHGGEVIFRVRPGEPRPDCCHEDPDEGVPDPGDTAGAPSQAGHALPAEAVVLHPAHHENNGNPSLDR